MEGLLAIFFIAGLLIALDLLSQRYGADSRPKYLDDWARSVAN